MRWIWTLRSCLSTVAFGLLTFLFSGSCVLASFVSSSPRVARWHLKWWGRIACFLFGARVVVHGFENWPFRSGAVVLFNHTSFFDVFAMTGYLPDMRFGAKQELFRIPIFGSAMRRVGILPIDRARREKVFQIYEKSAERLRGGQKIGLAPEGTRTQTPNSLGPFKAGPFVFALQAHVPLVPVVITGAYDIMPKGAWLPNAWRSGSELHLEILPMVSWDQQTHADRTELQNQVRDAMQAALARSSGARENSLNNF